MNKPNKNIPEHTNPVGRPSVYSMTDKWEEWIAAWVKHDQDTFDENGLEVRLPTIASLSVWLNEKLKKSDVRCDYVSAVTIEGYGRGENPKPEFLYALRYIKEEQRKRLINGGLSGKYNSTIAKLILSANHGMHEKKETEHSGKILTGFNVIEHTGGDDAQ